MPRFFIPIRTAWRFFSLIALLCGCGLAALTTLLWRPNNTVAKLHFGARWCRRWARVSLRLAGIHVKSDPPPSDLRFLLVSNHVSYVDIWVIGSLWPGTFIAKSEIRNWPIIGPVAAAAGTLFVNRNLARHLPRVMEEMHEHLHNDVPVVLFPEGGAGSGEAVGRFRPSLLEPAARAGIPCYAAAIRYETPNDPAPPTQTICWTDNRNLLHHAWTMLSMSGIEVSVRIDPVAHRNVDRKKLAANLEEASRRMFVPIRQSRRGSQISAPN